MSTFEGLRRQNKPPDATANRSFAWKKDDESREKVTWRPSTIGHRLGRTFVVEEGQSLSDERETNAEVGDLTNLHEREANQVAEEVTSMSGTSFETTDGGTARGSCREAERRAGQAGPLPRLRSLIRSALQFTTLPASSSGHSGRSVEKRARASVTDSSVHMASQFAGAHPTFSNFGFGMLCKSPIFKVSGQISVPPAVANGDLTVGFMQAIVGSTGPKGRYWDANDSPYMTAVSSYKSLPLRDADPGGVFYGPEAKEDVTSPKVTVSMGDQPQGSLPWTTPDGKGKLQQVVGDEQYVTWLAVLSDSTRQIEPLRYLKWNVGWFAAVDESQKEGTSFDVGRITDTGEGQGPMAPIRSGPAANDSKTPTQWAQWSG